MKEGNPLAFNDSYALTIQDRPVEGSIPNVSEYSNLGIAIPPKNGTAVINTGGKWSYMPFSNFVGCDEFIISISSENKTISNSKIAIDIRPDSTKKKCFKNLTIEYSLENTSSNFNNINSLNCSCEIIRKNIINTSIIQSLEGQILSGCQLNITGGLNYNFNYSVHKPSSTKKIPYNNKIPNHSNNSINKDLNITKLFSTYIIIPTNSNASSNIKLTSTIIDTYYKVVNNYSLYVSTYLSILVDNL